MSHPPELPGSRRLKKAASRSPGGAYEGAAEAVGAIIVAIGIGYWIDSRYGTTPSGVLIGAVVGFTAFVVRLLRLGKQLHPDEGGAEAGPGPGIDEDDRGVGEQPGISGILLDDDDDDGNGDEADEPGNGKDRH